MVRYGLYTSYFYRFVTTYKTYWTRQYTRYHKVVVRRKYSSRFTTLKRHVDYYLRVNAQLRNINYALRRNRGLSI